MNCTNGVLHPTGLKESSKASAHGKEKFSVTLHGASNRSGKENLSSYHSNKLQVLLFFHTNSSNRDEEY